MGQPLDGDATEGEAADPLIAAGHQTLTNSE
jgi:hypothetical protein